jgi:hypothetical protein
MKARLAVAAATLALGFFTLDLRASSGQAGVYGVIDKVVVESDGGGLVHRAQIWGTFALMETIGNGFTGYVYKRPARGYLYFKLPAEGPGIENARREWKDLMTLANTKQAVAFGYWDRNRGDVMMTVRDATTKPANPDIYYTDIGITKLNNTSGGIVEELLKLAAAR